MSQLEKMAFFGTISGNEGENPEVVDTRFGKITLQRSNAIMFPRGLLGMPDKRGFFVTEFPNEKFKKFRLLQCVDDHGLSFITLPIDLHNSIIAADDLLHACRELGISVENLNVLLIVSVHRLPQKVTISVNARAPLLIDSRLRLAAQYVFQTDKYQVQHSITL